MYVEDCTFVENTVVDGDGGSIALVEISTEFEAIISDSSFHNNSVPNRVGSQFSAMIHGA